MIHKGVNDINIVTKYRDLGREEGLHCCHSAIITVVGIIICMQSADSVAVWLVGELCSNGW